MTAREFAIKAHGDQRYNGKPYVNHLDEVADTLREFGFRDRELIESAYLHDVIEDCGISVGNISDEFGGDISALVFGVTDEPGINRKERKFKTYPKIAANPRCVVLKLADRIANTRAGIGTKFAEMYRREYPEFRASLINSEQHDARAMWAELDRLYAEDPEKVK